MWQVGGLIRWIIVLRAAAVWISPARAQGLDPVHRALQVDRQFDTGECDVYGTMDLRWDQILSMTEAQANHAYACQGFYAWTGWCFDPRNAQGEVGIPYSASKALLVCGIEFLNRDTEPVGVGPTQFVQTDVDGQAYDPVDSSVLSATDKLQPQIVAPGGVVRGVVTFPVPQTTTAPVLLEWRTSHFGNDSNGYASVAVAFFIPVD